MAEIGYLSRRFSPAEGGIENFLLALCEALAAYYQPRVLTQIVSNEPDRPGVDDIRARIYETPEIPQIRLALLQPEGLDRLRLWPCALRLLPGLRRWAYAPLKAMAVRRFASIYYRRSLDYFKNAALLHSFAFDGLGLTGLRCAQTLRIPYVITPFIHANRWGDSPENVAVYNSADAVIALHDQDAEALARIGVERERIRTCGVGIRPFSGNGGRFRAKYRIEGPLVLFVARLERYKGYQALVRAAHRLFSGGTSFTLVLVGPETVESRRFKAENAHPNIRFLGHLPPQEKYDALMACDLFCLPSESEIMPVTVLEAWHAGRPILVGDIPALRSLVRDRETGRFTASDPDALAARLREFFASPARWKDLAENGKRESDAKYLIHHVADRMAELYDEVMLGKREVTRA